MRHSSAVGLILALLVTLEGSAAVPEGPAPLSYLIWNLKDPLAGGFSGLEVSPDGSTFTAITDRGAYVTGQLQRGAGGVLTGVVTDGPMQPLHGIKGEGLKNLRGDSEGLAIDAQGRAYVSFEVATRVFAYADLAGRAVAYPRHPDFKKLMGNGSLEALAVAADGTLYALPEAEGPTDQGFPVYRFRSEAWDIAGTVPRLGDFLPVGADIGPDGQFYLLERSFHGVFGFANRLRRFAVGDAGLTAGRVLWETPVGRFGNMEGISVWQDDSGQLVASLISDNNKLPVLNTELVEFALPAD